MGLDPNDPRPPYQQVANAIRTAILSRTFEPGDKLPSLNELSERYSDAHQYRLDGISVEYDDWHFNVRASNTEPLLRLCLESLTSRDDMERRRDEVLGVIRS